MSRSTLIVVLLLVAVALLGWFQPWRAASITTPVPPPLSPDTPEAVVPELPEPALAPAPQPLPDPDGPPRIGSRADLEAFLVARGLRPGEAIGALQAWRERRGFLGPDPLTGIEPGGTRLEYYASLAEAELARLATDGDVGAMQALARRRVGTEPLAALDGLRAAARLGSAAAMLDLTATLRSLADTAAGSGGMDPRVGDAVSQLTNGDPTRNLNVNAMAWSLAAIRQHGPAVADRSTLQWLEQEAQLLSTAEVTQACNQSLGILGRLNEQGGVRDELPPVFTSERDLYARLPCADSVAPVTPPASAANCAYTIAVDRYDQPIEVWTCGAD